AEPQIDQFIHRAARFASLAAASASGLELQAGFGTAARREEHGDGRADNDAERQSGHEATTAHFLASLPGPVGPVIRARTKVRIPASAEISVMVGRTAFSLTNPIASRAVW